MSFGELVLRRCKDSHCYYYGIQLSERTKSQEISDEETTSKNRSKSQHCGSDGESNFSLGSAICIGHHKLNESGSFNCKGNVLGFRTHAKVEIPPPCRQKARQGWGNLAVICHRLRNNDYAAFAGGNSMADVARRTANDSMTRLNPLMIRLAPTKVPIAHAELEGHCR
jgi:hypothetical protein